mgnify:CR=1 FL=1
MALHAEEIMNQHPSHDDSERRFVHSAANRGLNRSTETKIPDKVWRFIKFFPLVAYSLVCLIPGLFMLGVGFLMLLYPAASILGFPSFFIILVGAGMSAVGIYLIKFIWKN